PRRRFLRCAVDGIFAHPADKFINRDWLKLALDANEIELAKNQTVILDGREGRFIDEDVRTVIFVEPFQARGEIHGVAEGGVAITQRGAHVADARHAGVHAYPDVEVWLAFGFPYFLQFA